MVIGFFAKIRILFGYPNFLAFFFYIRRNLLANKIIYVYLHCTKNDSSQWESFNIMAL